MRANVGVFEGVCPLAHVCHPIGLTGEFLAIGEKPEIWVSIMLRKMVWLEVFEDQNPIRVEAQHLLHPFPGIVVGYGKARLIFRLLRAERRLKRGRSLVQGLSANTL